MFLTYLARSLGKMIKLLLLSSEGISCTYHVFQAIFSLCILCIGHPVPEYVASFSLLMLLKNCMIIITVVRCLQPNSLVVILMSTNESINANIVYS